MNAMAGFSDGEVIVAGYVAIDACGVSGTPKVTTSVVRYVVFSAEHGLVREASGRVKPWMGYIDTAHRSEAEAHAWASGYLRSIAAEIEAKAAHHAAEAARMGVGEAVPA